MSEEQKDTDAGIIPALGDAGPCPVITTKAKVWTVGHPTQKAKAELELLVISTSLDNLETMKLVLPKRIWQEKAAALDAKIEGGHWKTWGSLWTSVNNGPDSQPLFLLSLLKAHHPEATLADAKKLWLEENRQAKTALAVTAPGFFAILAEAAPLPPEERAAMATQGLADFLESLRLTLAAPTESDSTAPTTP